MDSSSEVGHNEGLASIKYCSMKAGNDRNSTETSKSKAGSTKRRVAACELIVLSGIIGLAWMLLLLPIIFYYLPDEIFARKVSNNINLN